MDNPAAALQHIATVMLLALDLIGTFVFALSGTIVGVRQRLDIFGVLVLSFAASSAGGLMRDVLIGSVPPMAIGDWRYLIASQLAGLLIFIWFPRHLQSSRVQYLILICDAAGLGLFAVTGTQKALGYGLNPIMAPLLGMLSGIGGGMLLHFQPGTRWKYSLSIDVIGHIVEIISGQSLDRFFEEQIFKPLGMIDTAFYVPSEKVSRLAKVYGHVADNPQLEHIPVVFTEVLPHPPSHLIAGGGLFSTLPDYARFAQMLVNRGELDGVRLLSPTTVAMMEINQAPAEALPYGFADNDLYHAGYGYSIGMRVLMDLAAIGMAGSVGEFGWDGAFST